MAEKLYQPKSDSDSSHSSHPLYLSYLVRMWFVHEELDLPEARQISEMSAEVNRSTWRASAESPMTQEQRHFPDLESLFDYLRTMTGQGTPDEESVAEGRTDFNKRTE